MSMIPLGMGDWELQSEDISRFKLRNMYLIENPSSPDQISHITRPSLQPLQEVDEGAIMGFWRQAGSIDNRWLLVSGEVLWSRATTGDLTEIDDLPGDDYPDFAADKNRALVIRDGAPFFTDGLVLTPITGAPSGTRFLSVASINSYFILTVEDDDIFYWIDPAETVIDPFDFATAERTPDPLKAVRVIFDEVWFLGENGPEVWTTTGDGDAPLQRINGRVYSEGCESHATTATVLKNSLPALIWVTPQRSVVLAQGQVGKISNASVDELLETATNLRAWSFRTKKSDFYVLTSAEFTLVYDIQRTQWYRWDSYGYDFWRGHLGIQDGPNVYAGDALTGRLWRLGLDGFDDEDTVIVKEVTGLVLNAGDPKPCYAVNIRVNSGSAPDYDDPEPLELFLSDDMGKTWTAAIQAPMGNLGAYNTDVEYRSLGNITRPGRVFRFRHTDRTQLRVDYATLNEGLDDDDD